MNNLPNHLAPYAISPADAERLFAEPADAYRGPFQIDRDRVLRCSAFRRLDYKTQVFVPHVHDLFRTRMTHTVEVAQVSRNLARGLGLNEDMAEAVALAHDLGHPPFGHIGERALDECMAAAGGFEHNRQSLRVVDYIEHPFPDFRGLNLCNATRESLAKHETRYDEPACEQFANTGRAPLEGQLVDAADELAYTTADLEDALVAGWLTEEDLAGLQLWAEAMDRAKALFPTARPIHYRIQANRQILHLLCEDLLTQTRANINAMGIDSPQAARDAAAKVVMLSPDRRAALDETQDFLLKNVYKNETNLKLEAEHKAKLQHLFAAYLADPKKLPTRYQTRIDTDGLPRTICDYLAGMTDRYCNQQAVMLSHGDILKERQAEGEEYLDWEQVRHRI